MLSIGSGDDQDGQGRSYREYFPLCQSYTTSEVDDSFPCDLVLDVRKMHQLTDNSFDCVFCSGVLEHVDDHLAALREMQRILKPKGLFLLGVPFRQGLHLAPHDYWRFTEYGIRYLLREYFEILEIAPIDERERDFPAAYWISARKV